MELLFPSKHDFSSLSCDEMHDELVECWWMESWEYNLYWKSKMECHTELSIFPGSNEIVELQISWAQSSQNIVQEFL